MLDGSLHVALKEWEVVCRAVLAGQQAILLRKGGIYEAAGEFELEHSRFLLFPTLLHQKPDSVKPAWRDKIKRVDREPDTITIRGWAEVFWIGRVPDRSSFDQLDDLHLWDKPFIDMRFNYRPDYPLYVLVLRGWILREPATITLDEQYAGCKSWVPLKEDIVLAGSRAVMPETRLQNLRERIAQTFNAV